MKIGITMKFELDHLERRRVPVPRQIPDQPAIFIDLLGAGPVRSPGRLHDRKIGRLPGRHQPRHHIRQRHQTMIVDFDLPPRCSPHDVNQLPLGRFLLNRIILIHQ